MQTQIFVLPLLFMALASADLLKNPDFETPPSNFSKTWKSPFVQLTQNNTLPGWTFEGMVQYLTASETVSLPDDEGHAVQLGEDGRINQTFVASVDRKKYVLTFTIVSGGGNCSANADLVVSTPDGEGVFSLKGGYGKEAWQSYGHYLGEWAREEPINIVILSRTGESNSSSVCWPVIDKLLLKSLPSTSDHNGTGVYNQGFEFGPEFLSNSAEGILIEPNSAVQSPLPDWSIFGTVKYIDSDHFFVPQGKAAIEIVSGNSSGVEAIPGKLTEGSSYNLEFKLGDANDTCINDFIVAVQAGSTVQNFTLRSNGTGSSMNFSLKFKAASGANRISFKSFSTSQTKDGILCGPVVDDVVLLPSRGLKLDLPWKFMVFLCLFAILSFH